MTHLTTLQPHWLVFLGIAGIGVAVGTLIAWLVLRLARWLVTAESRVMAHVNLTRLKGPVYIMFPILVSFLAIRVALPMDVRGPLVTVPAKIAIVVLIYWLLLRVLDIATVAITKRYDMAAKDNLHARQVRTRISVVKSIATVLLFLAAMATIFMMFDSLRGLGVSLLASAGVAGIAIGFAAQKTLGNLLAGIQIALTQPIRLEDAVVVENEWGWVEEITLTYVVIRLWDLRRLVLPISYFIEHPFQNWTRHSAAIIGTVEFFADFNLPVPAVREELKRLLAGTMLWDGKTQVVQVTDCDAVAMKIRILVSAIDSPTAFDLRCYVRENILAFVETHYPQSLPRRRALIEQPSGMPFGKAERPTEPGVSAPVLET